MGGGGGGGGGGTLQGVRGVEGVGGGKRRPGVSVHRQVGACFD